MSRDEVLGAVARKALPKKPYSPSPCAGSERQRFRRLAHPIAGARQQAGWSLSSSTAAVSRGKTLVVDFFVCFSVAGCLLV
jgi:hypothetical protein